MKRKAESLPAVKELKTKLASYGYWYLFYKQIKTNQQEGPRLQNSS